jgi:hypothetical protein
MFINDIYAELETSKYLGTVESKSTLKHLDAKCHQKAISHNTKHSHIKQKWKNSSVKLHYLMIDISKFIVS